MLKRKYKSVIVSFIILSTILFHFQGLFYYIRSIAIMLPYSLYQSHKSPLYKNGISFKIPSSTLDNKDWYPLLLTHLDEKGFSSFTGKTLTLTVLYSFGQFQFSNRGSSIYDLGSSFNTSFYGGYAVYNNENPQNAYGFHNGSINLDELQLIPEYDQTKLVLPTIGCPSEEITFINKIDIIEENVSYLGGENWTKIDSTIITNSLYHTAKGFRNAYLQYGKPPKHYTSKSFPLVSLKGRAYVKYIEEYQMTFVLYIIGKDLDFINEWDTMLLSKASITKK